MAKAMAIIADQQPEGDKIRLQVAVVVVVSGNQDAGIRFDSNVIIDLGAGSTPNPQQLNSLVLAQVRADALARGISISDSEVVTANKFTT